MPEPASGHPAFVTEKSVRAISPGKTKRRCRHMKIIDAFWEERNLGIKSVEFVVESGDAETVIADILKAEARYNVAKLPVNKPKLTALLQENGYRFIECLLNFSHDLSKEKIAAAKLLSNAGVTYAPANKADLAEIFAEIDKELFNTDRIYNDAQFKKELAAIRYKNWINDELSRGAIVYELIFQGESIGFFALQKMRNDIFDPFLLGLFNAYKGKGFGRSMAFNALSESALLGARGISTHISSNNPVNIKVYKSLGYDVSGVKYVFIKHNK